MDSGQKPPFIKVLVWLTSLCPFGVSHPFFIPSLLGRARERLPLFSLFHVVVVQHSEQQRDFLDGMLGIRTHLLLLQS